jgi:putative ABC transport system substrate-binding protein
MKRAAVPSILVVVVLLAVAVITEAQQQGKVPRIGFLGATSPSAISARLEAFRQGLRDLGYVEGKNIVIDYRWAEGKLDRLPGLAAELVHLKVDIIVSAGSAVTRLAKEATNTIPIVMAFDIDPVASGFVASLARPGGNITGLATLYPEMSGKRLELLREIVPKLSHVAVFGDSANAGNAQALKETELAAGAFGFRLQYLDVRGYKDVETLFRAATKGRADGVLVLSSPLLLSQRKQVADLAVKSRLPTIFPQSEYVEDGGLMTYGVNSNDLYRRAAVYVDKILKGLSPLTFPWSSQRSLSS